MITDILMTTITVTNMTTMDIPTATAILMSMGIPIATATLMNMSIGGSRRFDS